MTSDAKVRMIVDKIRRLADTRTSDPPDVTWFDSEFDPDEQGPPLPFTAYCITGTAGAGKSTSITALYQNLSCLVSGATVVAAQNLSRSLRAFCPTIYTAFGFKSKHINLLNRKPQLVLPRDPSITLIQYHELSKYWPVVKDIMADFMKKKRFGLYQNLSDRAFNTLGSLNSPQLWTTNIIVIDEAGTLSSYILTAVIFLWWFFNGWLKTPQYTAGRVPCVVCVGSPTQTDAYQSLFNHEKQKHQISECDNILSMLIGNRVVSDYINVSENWALFINNKRCTDPEFGHMLKVLEYGLDMSDDVMEYINRLVVPKSRILDPLQYIGWTRLFLSHSEVKQYMSSLHSALSLDQSSSTCMLFTCPIVCEVFQEALEEYKSLVNLPHLTAFEWLTKNLHRISNYSQFVDQDMTAIGTDVDKSSVKVTYITKFVKGSYVSVNGKTKKCFCGFSGTYAGFKNVLDSETFLDNHSNEQPEHVYYFLSVLMYNAMYSFHYAGIVSDKPEYVRALRELPIPQNLCAEESLGEAPKAQGAGEGEEEEAEEDVYADQDVFYHKTLPPPKANSASLAHLISTYNSLKDVFAARLATACQHLGVEFANSQFNTFVSNMVVQNQVDYVCAEPIHGLLDFASAVESYKLQGYTFAPVFFGKQFYLKDNLSQDLKDKMPHLMVQDSEGFMCCLNNNITKMTENLENNTHIHLCSVGDYGVSSKLAMTIAKAQGLSLNKVAVCFGNHKKIKRSHVYVALSRATDPNSLVIDSNPLTDKECELDICEASKHIVSALHNPNTLLVY